MDDLTLVPFKGKEHMGDHREEAYGYTCHQFHRNVKE